MKTEYQTAIDLMNEVLSTIDSTDGAERVNSTERLMRYLLDNFEAPKYPRGAAKNTPEYEHWIEYLQDIKRTWDMDPTDLKSALIASPTDFCMPGAFVLAIMKVLLKNHRFPFDAKLLPSFKDFYKKYDHAVVAVGDLYRS